MSPLDLHKTSELMIPDTRSLNLTRRISRRSLILIGLAAVVPAAVAAWLPSASLYADIVALVVLIWLALIEQPARNVAITVSLIPLISLLIISAPTELHLHRIVILYGALAVMALGYSWAFHRHPTPRPTELTTLQFANAYSRMLIIGSVVGLIIFFGRGYQLPTGLSLLMVTLLAPLAALIEELFFRNLLQRRASAVMRDHWAMLLAALTYTAMVADFHSLIQSSLALLVGFTLALAYYAHRNVLFTFALNASIKVSVIGYFVLLH